MCRRAPEQPAQPAPRSPPRAAQPSSSRSCHGAAAAVRCACVAAAPAAQGLVPTQLCLQSSCFLQEAAHLPLPPLLGSSSLLASFPLTQARAFASSCAAHTTVIRTPLPLCSKSLWCLCSFPLLIPLTSTTASSHCLSAPWASPPAAGCLACPGQLWMVLLLLLLVLGGHSCWPGSGPEIQHQPQWLLLLYVVPLKAAGWEPAACSFLLQHFALWPTFRQLHFSKVPLPLRSYLTHMLRKEWP